MAFTLTKWKSAELKIADIRAEYRRCRLGREDLKADPIEQFNLRLEEACRAGVIEPTAMSLATSWSDGRPLVYRVRPQTIEFWQGSPKA